MITIEILSKEEKQEIILNVYNYTKFIGFDFDESYGIFKDLLLDEEELNCFVSENLEMNFYSLIDENLLKRFNDTLQEDSEEIKDIQELKDFIIASFSYNRNIFIINNKYYMEIDL